MSAFSLGLKRQRLLHRRASHRPAVGKSRLSAIVKGENGRTVMWWIDRAAIQHAKLLLRHTNLSMTEIADRLSLHSDSFLCRLFKRYTGITPLRYRKL